MKWKKAVTVLDINILPACVPFMAMYLIWCVMSAVAMQMGGYFVHAPYFQTLILPLFVLVYIFLALFITQLFMVYVNDWLDEIPILRPMMFAICGGLGFFVYMVMRHGTVKGVWITSLGTANLIVFACLVASWMIHPLKRPSELVPLCSVVALTDLFSVFAGPTRHLVECITAYYEKGMQGPPPLADYILVKISVPGFNAAMPLFGVSDWIILVFLSSALTKFGFSDNLAGKSILAMKKNNRLTLYLPAAALGLMVSIVGAQVSGMFLPALPFVVICFMAYALIRYPQIRDLNKREWLIMSVFSLAMILLLAVGLLIKSNG